MNEEISLSQAFDLGTPSQDNIIPDGKEPVNTIAMQDIFKQREMNLDFVENMNQKKEAGTLTEIGAGLERFYFGITDIPDNLKNAVIRGFNGHIFPNMTEQQATMLMESVTREQMARNQYRRNVEALEGVAPDSITANITSGIAQAVFYGLTGNFLGNLGMAIEAGAQAGGETSLQYAENYLAKHGSMEGYKGTDDFIYAGLNGVINGYIEQALGVENLFKDTVKKFVEGGKRKFILSAIEEGTEEVLQEYAGYTIGNLGDYLTGENYREERDFLDATKDALVNGIYGAIIGGAVGSSLYVINRGRISKKLQEKGFSEALANEIATEFVEEGESKILDEIQVNAELTNAFGESYEQLKTKIKNSIQATGTELFGEKLDEYVNLVAKDIGLQVITNARAFNIPTREYLDLANIQSFDNILSLERVDLNDVNVVKDLIKSKKAELKDLNLKQKTGIDTKAQRGDLTRQIAQLQVIQKKIDKPVSVEQKQNNPVLTDILGNKFNNITLTPQIKSMENLEIGEIINNMPELKTALKTILPRTQGLNKENFAQIINSPANNNNLKENVMSYVVTYGTPEQIKEFLVNYSNKQAENLENKTGFSDRDLLLQALEESGIGTEQERRAVLLSEVPSIDNTIEKQLYQERPQQYTQDTINIDGVEKPDNRGTYSSDTGNIYMQEGLLPQNANGYMDTELKTIVLGSNINQGTLPHEFAHFFLQKNFDLWKQGNPNAQFDMLAEQLGITKDQDMLTREQQEQFAYMTEAYIFGKGLGSNVSPVVKAYLNWIPAEYESVINMGYKRADGTEYNPVINDSMKNYFDTAYATLGLSTSPTVRANTNISDDKGEPLPSNKEVRLDRAKDIQKSIEPEKITMTAQDMAIETKALNKSGETADGWITTIIPGQGTNTREQQQQEASEWVGKNKEEAKRIAFGNHIQTESDFEQNTAPVDRAFVIREVMKDYSPDSVEYAMLKHKLATYLSLSGKALGLNNDLSFRLYLDNYKKLSDALEQKASFLRYGKSDKSVRLFNADIDKFVATWMDAIVNTKADSQERELAVRNFIESAKQEFETDTILMQEGIFEQLKKANRKNYNDLAKRYVKQMAGALPSNQNIADLMRLSNRAQALSKNIDSNNTEEAITAGKAIRELQNYIRDKGIPQGFMQKLIGGWMPRAMLSSPSTHLTNALSNSVQAGIIKATNRLYYGKNIVSKQVMNNEKARLKKIYENTGFNLAQQYTINDKALIKGEKYETTPNAEAKGWVKLDPMKFLGDSDFFFRNNLYIDTLSHIASKNANGDVKKANELFNKYKQLATTDEESLKARQEALLVANIGVFTQNGKFAAILSQIRNSLDMINVDISKQGVAFGVKGNQGLGTMLAPFIKTPANIIELGARAIASPFTTIYTLAKGKKLSITQAIDLGEATTALLIFFALVKAGAKYQGTDDPYDRKNDTIQFGDFAIKLDNFGVMAQPLRQAMTLSGMYMGKDWVNTGLSQLPILSEVEKVKLMRDDFGKFINDFTAEQAGKVVPSLIKPITKKAIGYRPENKYFRKWTQSMGITQSRSAIDDWTEALSKVVLGSKIQFR